MYGCTYKCTCNEYKSVRTEIQKCTYKMKKNERIEIRVSADEKAIYQRIADSLETSLSDICLQSMRVYIEGNVELSKDEEEVLALKKLERDRKFCLAKLGAHRGQIDCIGNLYQFIEKDCKKSYITAHQLNDHVKLQLKLINTYPQKDKLLEEYLRVLVIAAKVYPNLNLSVNTVMLSMEKQGIQKKKILGIKNGIIKRDSIRWGKN
jgi:DNA-directed RNA polymerase sigma subunit (sigma70/sigma32)